MQEADRAISRAFRLSLGSNEEWRRSLGPLRRPERIKSKAFRFGSDTQGVTAAPD